MKHIPQRKLLISLILVILASFVAYQLWLSRVGTTLPDFAIVQENGQQVAFSELKGEVTILHFWATWCAPCIKELPELDAYIARNQNAKLKIVPVSLDGYKRIDKVNAFLIKYKLEHIPSYTAKFSQLGSKLKLRNLPVTIVVKDDQVIKRINGPVQWVTFEPITHLLNAK